MANLITVAPGVFVDPAIRHDIDPRQEYVLLDAAGYRSLGLTESLAHRKLINRLEYAGKIKCHQITPRRKLLCLSTWRKHLTAVETDPDFWDRPEHKRTWRIACMST
jgi:hypothetical protein